MKVLTVVGARPQFIKASALSRALGDVAGVREVLVHTGQHFDDEMSDVFFRELELREPDYNLGISGGGHASMTGRMMEKLEPVIGDEQPNAVIVYGDTNSTLAGALVAAKAGVPIVHVEAGLRSFNRSMPEEINRIATDHLATLLCCPTATAVANLRREGFARVLAGGALARDVLVEAAPDEPIVANVGDVMLDVLRRHNRLHADDDALLCGLGVAPRAYAVLTVHRAGNTASLEHLATLLEPAIRLARELPVIFVVHPRTRSLLEGSRLQDELVTAGVRLIAPLGYVDFLRLQRSARLVVTDSGGVQKEAFFLGVPCVTLRQETEWPETVLAGANALATRPGISLLDLASRGGMPPESTAFGDGRAAERIVSLIRQLFLQHA